MVAQLGQCENYSVCSEMNEVWAVKVVCVMTSNAQCHELSSPLILNLISRLLIHEVPGGCAGWRLGRVVFVNQQIAGYESTLSYLTSWAKKLQELGYMYPFFTPTPPFTFPSILNTPPASWTISTSCDMHKTMPPILQHTRQPTPLYTIFLGFLPLHTPVSSC